MGRELSHAWESKFLSTHQSININQIMNRTKSKNHMIISTGTDKIEYIKHQFMITNAHAHPCLFHHYLQ
jgi:hypothetical protein